MALSSTDPKALFQQAACFNCPEPHRNIVLQTYLLAQLAGVSTTAAGVQALEAAAACFDCLTIPQLLRLKTYLYAVLLAKPTDYDGVVQIVHDAACVMCLTPIQRRQLETYLLATAAGDSTDKAGVAAIIAAAKCFQTCPTTKEQYQIQVYLLQQLAPGQSVLSVSDLMAASKCFQSCIPGDLVTATEALLAISVASVALPPCVTPSHPYSLRLTSARTADPTTQLNVSWLQLPNAGGSLITGYIVYWGTTSGVYTNNSGTLPATPHSYTITGLTAATTYFVVVKAVSNVTASCISDPSAEVSATTQAGSSICAAGQTFADNWALRVVANGGAAPSLATKQAIATFWCGLITDGLDTQMVQINCFVPDSLIACITQQLNLFAGSDPWTNHNFVAGDLTVNGLTGNAVNKFLDTGWIIPGGLGNTNGICVYNYNVTATGFEYGGYNGTLGLLGAAKHTDNNAYSYNGNTGTNAITVASPGNGFYSAQRVNANDHRLYFATSLSPHAQIGATDVAANGGYAGVSQHIFEVNLSGASQFTCSNTISFVAYTTGLSAADSAKLFARVQTLRTSLGGGFR